ncbi:MAG: GntR family transcriptional regulator [Chitinivibrionales bacterium]|nr:GntR family transcriptional regulator [Chitinivibrionales bacterium]
MANRRSQPAVAAAYAAVTDLIANRRKQGRIDLPTVAQLAAHAGVSKTTLGVVLKRLAAEGLICTRRGSGIRIAGSSTVDTAPVREAPVPPVPAPRWRQVRDSIVADYLVSVSTGSHVLPGTTSLMARYGAGHETVRRALLSLVDDGRLRGQGRRYRRGMPHRGATPSGVVLITPGNIDGRPAYWYPNDRENDRRFEQECTQRGIIVHRFLFLFGPRVIRPASPSCHTSIDTIPGPVLGVIAWMPQATVWALRSVLAFTTPQSIPLAVCARPEDTTAFVNECRGRTVRGFVHADHGQNAGAAVGRYLLKRGHRRILYVCPEPGDDCRAAGLREACARCEDTVRITPATYVPPSMNPDPQSGMEDYRTVFDNYVKAVAGRLPDGDAHAEIHAAVSKLYLAVRRQVLSARLECSIRRAWRAIPRSCRPTAIVAWNDAVAQVCMKLLSEDGMQVPREVSIISFDDSDTASAAQITSYNFNEFRTMCEMLDWVTWLRRRQPNRVMPPPQGFITERGSVGRG